MQALCELTENLSRSAGNAGKPRIVCDLFDTPVKSIQRCGPWKEDCGDSFLQGPLDETILQLLQKLGWLHQLFDDPHYLSLMCLNSLVALRDFLIAHPEEVCEEKWLSLIDAAIATETQREKRFYPDE